jgi:hypothetical protein
VLRSGTFEVEAEKSGVQWYSEQKWITRMLTEGASLEDAKSLWTESKDRAGYEYKKLVHKGAMCIRDGMLDEETTENRVGARLSTCGKKVKTSSKENAEAMIASRAPLLPKRLVVGAKFDSDAGPEEDEEEEEEEEDEGPATPEFSCKSRGGGSTSGKSKKRCELDTSEEEPEAASSSNAKRHKDRTLEQIWAEIETYEDTIMQSSAVWESAYDCTTFITNKLKAESNVRVFGPAIVVIQNIISNLNHNYATYNNYNNCKSFNDLYYV